MQKCHKRNLASYLPLQQTFWYTFIIKVISLMEKSLKKKTHTHIMNHFAVHLNLSQYCKSTLLQLKKNQISLNSLILCSRFNKLLFSFIIFLMHGFCSLSKQKYIFCFPSLHMLSRSCCPSNTFTSVVYTPVTPTTSGVKLHQIPDSWQIHPQKV